MSSVFYISVAVAVLIVVPLISVIVGGARVNRSVVCDAGVWTPVVKNFGTAFPRTMVIELHSDGELVSGRWR